MTNNMNSTKDKKKHRMILHVIPRGKLNAVSMRDISRLLKTDDRSVRQMIEKARIDGHIIAGTDAGIFIPETDSELNEYTSRTLSRIQTSIMTLDPALRLKGKSLSLTLEDIDHE